MSVGEREKRTQQRVIAFLTNALGYTCLGHWQERADNSNIEERLLSNWLSKQGHTNSIVRKVLEQLRRAAATGGIALGVLELNRAPLAHADWKY